MGSEFDSIMWIIDIFVINGVGYFLIIRGFFFVLVVYVELLVFFGYGLIKYKDLEYLKLEFRDFWLLYGGCMVVCFV